MSGATTASAIHLSGARSALSWLQSPISKRDVQAKTREELIAEIDPNGSGVKKGPLEAKHCPFVGEVADGILRVGFCSSCIAFVCSMREQTHEQTDAVMGH